MSVTTHVLYYECGCVILLIRYESSIGILLQHVRIVCMLYSMYVCCMCVYLMLLRRVSVLGYHSLFLLKYGSLGENIFRGVWNKAQALVYVVFSVRVLLILM